MAVMQLIIYVLHATLAIIVQEVLELHAPLELSQLLQQPLHLLPVALVQVDIGQLLVKAPVLFNAEQDTIAQEVFKLHVQLELSQLLQQLLYQTTARHVR
jgi:hypothetical protein